MIENFDRQYAVARDADDPLLRYRHKFSMEDESLIYLDGNSLGRLPRETMLKVQDSIKEEWGRGLIRSWNADWYEMSQRMGAKIARLIGADPEEVIMADSVSVGLYKLAYGALRLKPGRTEILSDDMNFPSDLYVLQGLLGQIGEREGRTCSLRLLKSPDGINSGVTDMLRLLGKQTALVSFSLVAFKSAYMYDLPRVTEMAQLHGALTLWDLSHAVGAVPIDLHAANVDLAVGCTYKYLSGGPASPAFLYIRRDLQEAMENPIKGWFGHNDPFEFNLHYRPARGIRKFLTSSPSVLAMKAVEPGLDLVLDAGIEAIRAKSMAQTQYLVDLAREKLFKLGFRLGSPEFADRRGSHVSLKHPEAYRICRALIDPGLGDYEVIPDFREPNNIRLGLAPLYTSFEEIWLAVEQLRSIMEERSYERYSLHKQMVT